MLWTNGQEAVTAFLSSRGINPTFVQMKLSFDMNRRALTMHYECSALTNPYRRRHTFEEQDQQKIMQTSYRDFWCSRRYFEFMTWIRVKLEVLKSSTQPLVSLVLGHHKKSTSKSLKNVLWNLAHQLLVVPLVILWSPDVYHDRGKSFFFAPVDRATCLMAWVEPFSHLIS